MKFVSPRTRNFVIVFSLLIPVLLWRSFASQHSEEEVEE